jgi:tetratricopeptide (TPR) repeat protein
LTRALQPYFDTDRCDELMEQTNTALCDVARRQDSLAAEACALIGLADHLQIRGLRSESLAMMVQAHRTAGRCGSARMVAVTAHLIASICRLVGASDRARQWIDQAIERATALDDGGLVLAVCYQEAGTQALTVDDDPHRAVSLLTRASKIAGDRQSIRRSIIASMRMAQAYRSLGELAAAERCLRSAIGDCRALPDDVGAGYLLLELGELYRAGGRLELAERCLVEASRTLGDVGRPTGAVIAIRRLADLYVHRGERERARRVLQETLDALTAVRVEPLAAVIRREVEGLSQRPFARVNGSPSR